MSDTQYKTIARRFVEEIFNARKTEMTKNFVTPDIIYHGMGEEVRSLEEFKKGLLKISWHFQIRKSQI